MTVDGVDAIEIIYNKNNPNINRSVVHLLLFELLKIMKIDKLKNNENNINI